MFRNKRLMGASLTFDPSCMPNKVMKKFLIRNSFLLFVIYMLSSIMFISLYDNTSWAITLVRSISIGFSTFLVFIINANIIIYYKSRDNKGKSFNNVQKRIFITGYIATLFVFCLSQLVGVLLRHLGVELHFPKVLEQAEGWKIGLLIAYLSLMQYTFIYLIQNFTMSQYEKNRIEVQLLRLKSSNAETTNQLLKQQIQPHFLFNALTILKSLIRKDPKVAEFYLLRLSDFLRVSITKNKSGIATVKEEIKVCDDYMEMQKIRFGEALQYRVDIPADDESLNTNLPFFALQPLLENAIKHNELTEEMPLWVRISREDDYIVVTNNLQERRISIPSTKTGHDNLKERYKILSGEDLIIQKTHNSYIVKLKILGT